MQSISILIYVRVIFRIWAQSDIDVDFYLLSIYLFPYFYSMTIIVINSSIPNVFFILGYFSDILALSKKKMTL